MGNGPRYKVQTRYGWFSLDEGSYRDYLSGKLHLNNIRILVGDQVKVEMSLYDLTKGRIVWRDKN